MSPIGTIHATCAFPYLGTVDILDRLERLSPDLSGPDLNELGALIRESVNTRLPVAPESEAEDSESAAKPESTGSPASPGLAKARPEAPPEAAAPEAASKNGR
jgi:hypothetical protein